MKIFRFNALYPAYLVLLGFLVFDIFWAFMGPMLFNGHSVIHEVLNGLDFPVQLAVPGFTPFVPCATLSILDIVVPTFYISFISRFGKAQDTNAYYTAHCITYALSLGTFTCVMVYTESKQPALMYIIPGLFLTTWIVAGVRGEWRSKLSFDSRLEDENSRLNGKSGRPSDIGNNELGDVRGGNQFKKFQDEQVNEEEETT